MATLDHWPLFGLRVTTPRLELRYPTDDDIAVIAERAAVDSVHDPAFMPFEAEWTDVAPPLLQRNTLQYLWSLRATWQPTDWHCNMAVVVDGRIVGMQEAFARHFATLRSAASGSFLFLPEQGRGIGTEMRAAILHLVFAGLGAIEARTAAWADNAQSLGVTRRLGYEPCSSAPKISRGRARTHLDFVLTSERWQPNRRDDITIEGLEPCLDLFGLG